ncbi:MAG TPA: CGNR zinc finger domain-containing protein [Hyphomonadaceae bacterium]|nr:CGNR zinc finger domain-containing protein [Hyphomonadaceae bacterium]
MQSALFLADHPALDFVNTHAQPDGVPTEWVGDGDALISWLRESSLIPHGDERAIRAAFTRADLDQVAKDARSLRQWFRGAVTEKLTPALLQAATRRVNAILKDDEQVRLLDMEDALDWKTQRLWRSPKSILGPIAEQMGKLLTEEDTNLIRQCGGEDCTIVFLDRTKSHKRRWCSMAACGNRAKVAAWRARSAE